MPTAVTGRPGPAASFGLRALAWGLTVFGLLKLRWFETHCLLPFTRLQGRLGAGFCGAPAAPIDTTLACSGADAIALCLAAVLAFPATWRVRLAGAGGGLALVVALNTLRIGTLGRAAASPRLFAALHAYLWPAVLTAAVAGYVLVWMRVARRRAPSSGATSATGSRAGGAATRFVLLVLVFSAAFVVVSPRCLESRLLLSAAAQVAGAAAALLRLGGLDAVTSANMLVTPRGSFLVTQECLCSPLIPVYLAAAAAFSRTWRGGALGFLAAAPLFAGLGVARLLVVALPDALVGSPLFAIHAFSQVLLAAAVVLAAAVRRHGAGRRALQRALLAMAVGVLAARVFGPPLARLASLAADALAGVLAGGSGAPGPLDDPQGAVSFLPPFQVGFYLALALAAFAHLGRGRHAVALGLLGLGQVAALAGVRLLQAAGAAPHVRDVRAWAVLGPLLALALVAGLGRRAEGGRAVALPGEGRARG